MVTGTGCQRPDPRATHRLVPGKVSTDMTSHQKQGEGMCPSWPKEP